MISISAFPKCWIEDICFGRMDLFEWMELSVQLECEGLELFSGFLKSHDRHYLGEVRKKAEGLGMRLPMMCYSPDFTMEDPKDLKNEIDKQKQMIHITAELGGKYCRTLSGQNRPGMPVDTGVEQVVRCIEACIPEAEKCGVYLVIENHYKDSFWKFPEFAQKKDVFLSILKRLDSPFFGVQYDPSNAIVAGDDPLELLDEVLPRVMTMHASDRFLTPGKTIDDIRQADGSIGYSPYLCHGVTGKGLNNYDEIFKRLVYAGFNGWISIEDGMNGLDEMKESIDFLKRMRIKYQRCDRT